MIRRPPRSTLFPYNDALAAAAVPGDQCGADAAHAIAAAFAAAPGLDAAWHCRGHGGRHAVVGPGGRGRRGAHGAGRGPGYLCPVGPLGAGPAVAAEASGLAGPVVWSVDGRDHGADRRVRG